MVGGTISIIILAQKWNLVPTFIRQAYTFVITFPLSKPQILEMIRDVTIPYSSSHLSYQLNSLQPFTFIYINILKGKLFDHTWR